MEDIPLYSSLKDFLLTTGLGDKPLIFDPFLFTD